MQASLDTATTAHRADSAERRCSRCTEGGQCTGRAPRHVAIQVLRDRGGIGGAWVQAGIHRSGRCNDVQRRGGDNSDRGDSEECARVDSRADGCSVRVSHGSGTRDGKRGPQDSGGGSKPAWPCKRASQKEREGHGHGGCDQNSHHGTEGTRRQASVDGLEELEHCRGARDGECGSVHSRQWKGRCLCGACRPGTQSCSCVLESAEDGCLLVAVRLAADRASATAAVRVVLRSAARRPIPPVAPVVTPRACGAAVMVG
jgi:hypothetical protein